jgi:hypothetical protein
MTVSLVDRGIAAETVVVSFAVYVPQEGTGSPVEDDWQGVVVVGAIFFFEFEVMTGGLGQLC